MDGVWLVDKPPGPTSFDVVARVRRLTGVKRVGHAGTLDPMATGLLPILIGEAAKLTPWLQGMGKRYRATVRLGAATDTYDAEGQVTARGDFSSVTEEMVRSALTGFVGTIRQRPPAHSALKRDGKRLYELARKAAPGEVQADEREVTVYAIALERFAPPDVAIAIECGKGTYVRSIAHDLGGRLGVPAHLAALRRTHVGRFDVAAAKDVFAEGEPPALIGLTEAVAHLPPVAIDEAVERRVRMGQQAVLKELALPGGAAALVNAGRLVAIVDGGEIARVFR
jgi:tRNA pseudouridine55 synthase